MASKLGKAELFIGGKDRTVRFDFNAICTMEEMYDKPITSIFSADADGMLPFRVIRDGLAVGLEHEGRITPRQVGAWIGEEMERLPEFGQALTEAVESALAALQEKGDKGGNPQSPAHPETKGEPSTTTDS